MSISAISHIILPLYIYPANGGWDTVYSSVAANPDKNFTIIVNPSTGPGSGMFPAADYITGISKLNSYSNTQVLGYVDTYFTQVPLTTVNNQVAQYQNWRNYPNADIHVDGIFFDDVKGTYDTATWNYYSSIYSSTKLIMGPGFQHVLLNAGASVDHHYFSIADEVIVFEDYYSNYKDDTPSNIPAMYRSKASFLIHHFTDNAARQQQIIDNLVGNLFQGVYISTTGSYSSTGAQQNAGVYEYMSTLWTRFCNDMYSN